MDCQATQGEAPSSAATELNEPGGGGPRGVLVVGEALIDIVPREAGGAERVPGGSPANVALGLGRLGVPTSFLTHIARDSDGDTIVDHLEASGVRVLSSSRSAKRTSTAAVALDGEGNARYSFDVTWELPVGAAIEVPGALHIGSYGAFAAPGAETVLALARLARGAGRLVSFDPNIRADLLGDRASVRERCEVLASLADIVKLSDEDARWLFPGDRPGQVLDRLLGLGVALAVVTLGSRGSILATPAARAAVRASTTPTVDTIGAGDSFMAAMVCAALRWHGAPSAGPARRLAECENGELALIGGFGSAAAALTVSRRGADLPWRGELEDLCAPRGLPWPVPGAEVHAQ